MEDKSLEERVELNELRELEIQVSNINSRILILKRKYNIGIHCCSLSESTNGWHHHKDCVNCVLCY